MANEKDTFTVKKVAAPIKGTATVKAEDLKTEVKAEVKAEVKKAAAPAKAATPAKAAAPAKKATAAKKPAAKKATPAKKAVVSTVITLQYDEKSYTKESLEKIAKDVWVYDYDKKASELKKVELYVKPFESKVYYVFNDDITGSFDI